MCNEKIYLEYLEKRGHVSDRVIAARDALHEALDEYIEALQEWEFYSAADFVQNRYRAEEMKKGER